MGVGGSTWRMGSQDWFQWLITIGDPKSPRPGAALGGVALRYPWIPIKKPPRYPGRQWKIIFTTTWRCFNLALSRVGQLVVCWWLQLFYHGNLRVPPQCHPPPRNNPLMRPYFLGGWHWGVPLDSHDSRTFLFRKKTTITCRDICLFHAQLGFAYLMLGKSKRCYVSQMVLKNGHLPHSKS